MTDPRTPGVYVNGQAAGATPAIAGVATSTAAFVGLWPEAPGDGAPVLVTNLREVDAAAGAGRPLQFTDGPLPPHVWHAARSFFEEGGTRLYLVPVPQRADGARPRAAEYASALTRLDSLDEVAMVAAPGSTAAYPRAPIARRRDCRGAGRARRANAPPLRHPRQRRGADDPGRARPSRDRGLLPRRHLLPLGARHEPRDAPPRGAAASLTAAAGPWPPASGS